MGLYVPATPAQQGEDIGARRGTIVKLRSCTEGPSPPQQLRSFPPLTSELCPTLSTDNQHQNAF